MALPDRVCVVCEKATCVSPQACLMQWIEDRNPGEKIKEMRGNEKTKVCVVVLEKKEA